MSISSITVNGISICDKDFANPEDFIPDGEYNPHKVRPYLLHEHGQTVCVIFADSMQDALDIAVDKGKLDRFLIPKSELDDYNDEGIAYLGNGCEPFDIDNIEVELLKNPKMSLLALFNASGI